MTLLDRQVEFTAALRAAGLRVSAAEGIDAVNAVLAVGFEDRAQLRAALSAAMVKRQVQRPVFDAVFDVFYPPVVGESVRPPSSTDVPARPPGAADRGPLESIERDRIRADLREFLLEGDQQLLEQAVRDAVEAFGRVPGRQDGTGRSGGSWSRLQVINRIAPQTLMAGLLDAVLGAAGSAAGTERGGLDEAVARATFARRLAEFDQRVGVDIRRRLAENSDAATVARTAAKPAVDRIAFLSATQADLSAMRREITPLARRLAARLALDRRRGSRGQLDFRRTIRESLSTGGVPVSTWHRPRRPLRTELVVLCDLSQSVSSFAYFTLLLTYALREQFSKLRAFAFVDEVDEVTRFFTPGGDVLDTITRLTQQADVTGLLGRTDYGRSFELFAERFPDAVTSRTSLLILGDARSNYGDLALPVLRQLADTAKHAHWLNPERRAAWDSGDSEATRFGDVVPMTECRDLAQLTEFVRTLAR